MMPPRLINSALRWKLSSKKEYVDAMIHFECLGKENCKGIYRENGSLIDPNELLIAIQAYQLANAAEILRGYEVISGVRRRSLRLSFNG